MPGILVFPNDWYILFFQNKIFSLQALLVREIKNCEPAERKLERHLEKIISALGFQGTDP